MLGGNEQKLEESCLSIDVSVPSLGVRPDLDIYPCGLISLPPFQNSGGDSEHPCGYSLLYPKETMSYPVSCPDRTFSGVADYCLPKSTQPGPSHQWLWATGLSPIIVRFSYT